MRRQTALSALLFLASIAPSFAAGEEIRAAISGNTVQGNMDASGPYAEFYDADGTIKAADYSGQWSIEGDTMCFAYPETPTECWNVEIKGDQVRWIKDGASQGTGTILKGNANGF